MNAAAPERGAKPQQGTGKMRMSNVTALPPRDDNAPRAIMNFKNGYLENIFFGGGWKRLAVNMADNRDKLPKNMRSFVLDMANRAQRPTKKQLATLLGLMISARVEELFNEWDTRNGTDGANVVRFKR